MNWTEKHDQFCLENKLTPSAKLLWQFLVHRYDENEEIEPDLDQEFNAWVKKYRQEPFSINTIKTAFNRLVDCEAIRKIKQWSWREVRIITFPPYFFRVKKNLRNRHLIDEKQPSNDLSTETGDSSSSIDINHDLIHEEVIGECEQILDECESAGIVFNPIQSPEILNYSIEDVKLAIALFQKRGGHNKISNPQGWLLACLRRRWFEQASEWSFSDLLTALKAHLSYAK
jgi:hypothetical protein